VIGEVGASSMGMNDDDFKQLIANEAKQARDAGKAVERACADPDAPRHVL
jgi:hypothetical protein